MDDSGQLYFDNEEEIPQSDKERLEEVQRLAKLMADADKERLSKAFPRHEGPGFPE